MTLESSISIVLSAVAIVISCVTAYKSNEIGRAAIRADNCKDIFDKYLIEKIPKSRSDLRFGSDGKLRNGNALCEDISSMLLSALFYKYDDKDFFADLRAQCEAVEDLVAEAANHPRSSEYEQKAFFNELQKDLEAIYEAIDQKRIGKKHRLPEKVRKFFRRS